MCYLDMYSSSTMVLHRGQGACEKGWSLTYSSMHAWQKRWLHGSVTARDLELISRRWNFPMHMGHASPAKVFAAVRTRAGSMRVGIPAVMGL